jgi:hypothetical protein
MKTFFIEFNPDTRMNMRNTGMSAVKNFAYAPR